MGSDDDAWFKGLIAIFAAATVGCGRRCYCDATRDRRHADGDATSRESAMAAAETANVAALA